ncbi:MULTISPECIES: phage holin family protein [unclassified Nocardioides]|uniref:phage holin family protein n=1 Tax=unclassified Nocardioides TaxID=2615069 RepID=UPI003608108C
MTFRFADLARMAVSWLVSTAALAVAVRLLPGLHADSAWPLFVAAATTGIVGVLVRPVLVEVGARIGWLALGALAVVGQAAVMYVALVIVPDIDATSFWSTVAAAWIAAVVGTILSWLLVAHTPESFAAALRRTGKRHPPVSDPDTDGVVFIQLDGVAQPVMQWALASGTMPTLRGWVDEDSHRLHGWTVQIPCTTPASQLGILHGTCDRVPAFRWYDRELGRVLVANRPADAAIIEERASDGRGLLADDGISVSNLFTGDAPRSSMTMSRTALSRGSTETRRAFGWFLVRPDGFARSLARTVAEVWRERFQARRQRLRDVQPRVHRNWTFAALRAVSNGLLRDLNTAIVADELMRGTRAIYVDYVDYDEVAHHAGGSRIESLAALEGLDTVLAVLSDVAQAAPRRYHLVVLSDHGQSMGQPFASRYGIDLAGLCAQHMEESVTSLETNVESWGRAESIVDDLSSGAPGSRSPLGRTGDRLRRHTGPVTADHGDDGGGPVVLGSGNLGLVYLRQPTRLHLEDLEERHPRLLAGLAAHPGIGFLSVLSRRDGPVVLGAGGRRRLSDGAVDGIDPLAPFGEYAAAAIARATLLSEAPDIYVNSAMDPSTQEIAAFEDLVGAHGGLGGWQDHGMLLAPVELLPDAPAIVGADMLHRVLVGMLEQLGHRTDLGTREVEASPG